MPNPRGINQYTKGGGGRGSVPRRGKGIDAQTAKLLQGDAHAIRAGASGKGWHDTPAVAKQRRAH